MLDIKKLFVLLLAGLVAVSLFALAGCETTTDDEADEEEEEAAEELGSVIVMGVWGADELASFEAVVAGWEDETGGTMEFEGTRDLSPTLRTRVEGGNPPDLAILPNPALLDEFGAAGDLQSLEDVLDMDQLSEDYSQGWIDLGSVDGTLHGLFVKAATKSTVWYNPKTFEASGYETPETWDEMVALSDEMIAAGETPWSIGVEAGGGSGWAATDWIQEIYLNESGPDMYDQWVAHEIPWTDPSVKSAFEKFGAMALTEGYVAGGADAILATTVEDASYMPFKDPPESNMYFLGAFTQGFISAQFPDLVAEEDYSFFHTPTIDEANAGAVTGGADVVVMFNDTPEAASLMEYLARGDVWGPWAEAGGFQTPNKSFDQSLYPDPLAEKAAMQLTESEIFRFDADDLMPAEVQAAFFGATLDYLQDPGSLDAQLQAIEDVAAEAY